MPGRPARHTKRHTRKPGRRELPASPGWLSFGHATAELLERREAFLRAAVSFRPSVEGELLALEPLARQAAKAIRMNAPAGSGLRSRRSAYYRWVDVEAFAAAHFAPAPVRYVGWVGQQLASVGLDIEPHLVPPGDYACVVEFRLRLLDWAVRWHLTSADDEWVLNAAAEVLLNSRLWSPLRLCVPPNLHEPPLPLGRGRLVFDSFTGGDVKRWLEHQMVEVHAQLTAHAASQIASLSQAGAIPMKQRDKSQRVHLERAARWHVGDEAWPEFIAREIEGSDLDASAVRPGLVDALSVVGLRPRLGRDGAREAP